jgi:excisionase family DNA binding protein
MHVQPIRLRYSVNEAAAMLGVSTKTVRRRIKSGQIRATHDGSRVFISWDELDRYAKRDLILKAS